MKLLIALAILISSFAAPTPAQDTRMKLEGQVVCCAECWAEADRTRVEYGTTENLLKAKSCVEGGDPTLLAVREGRPKFRQFRVDRFDRAKVAP